MTTTLSQSSVIAAILLGLIGTTSAQAADTIEMKISAEQPLGDALQSFARQSNLQLIFFSEVVAGKESIDLDGEYEVTVALDELLADTGLTYTFLDKTSISIQPSPPVEEEGSSDPGNFVPASSSVLLTQNQRPVAKTQQQRTLKATNGTNDDQRARLEEIVVTAQKREQDLQGVPIAITAFTAESIKTKGLTNITHIADFTPNVELDYSAPFSGSTQVLGAFIRGIGQNDFAFNLEPGVGVYIDGVYYGRTVGAVSDMLDLDHVEILKGPQGTLFGRNSIGGAISIITRKPENEFTTKGEVTLGRFNRLDLRGSVDIPLINDRLSSQFAFSSKDRDGYQERIPFPSATPYVTDAGRFAEAASDRPTEQGGENTQNFRGKLLWHATGSVDVLISGDLTHVNEQAAPSTLIDTFAEDPATLGSLYNACISLDPVALAGAGIDNICGIRAGLGTAIGSANADGTNTNDRLLYTDQFLTGDIDTNFAGGPNFSKIDAWGISATIDWDVDDSLKLKSISAYRELESSFGTDGDGSPIVINDPSFSMDQEQISQELQLIGMSFDERLDWVLGLYYFHEEGNMTDFVNIAGGLLQILGPNDFSTDAYAAFVHTNYSITEPLSITAGIRYTYEDKEFFGGQRDLNSLAARLGFPLFLHPDPTDTTLYYPPTDNSKSFSNVTLKFGLEYQASKDTMTYVSYSEGFKSGGWTTRATLPILVAPDFAEETAATYEIGVKSQFFDNRLQVNAAGFFTDYEDLQVTVQRGVSPTIENAGQSQIKGVEIDFHSIVSDNFALSGGIGYVDAKYTELDPMAAISLTDQFNNTPEWSGSISGVYSRPLENGGTLQFSADYAYKSKIANDFENTPELIQDAVTLVNASATYISPSEKWEMALGGRNLTDERYIVTGFRQPGVGHMDATYSRPVEWFVTLRVFN